MFIRFYDNVIDNLLEKNKVLILYGPRRVGKSTLIKKYLNGFNKKYYLGFGEDTSLKELFRNINVSQIKTYFSSYELVVIDEAQKIENIGEGLKVIVDHIENIKVLVTGSSSLDLANKTGEPLTGRNKIITLYPLSALELINQYGPLEFQHKIEEHLIYGLYPEVLKKDSYKEQSDYLRLLSDSYLYKDILELENIRNANLIRDLLKLLAFQIGNEVSLTELANSLSSSKQTVSRYLDLLDKAFVVKNIRGFSRNLRKEVTKTSRYYFYDNGVRNAIINNFNDLGSRSGPDKGMLWENFLVMERIKKQEYRSIQSNNYFWRTWDQKEVDFVEEREGRLYGYEFKWGTKKTKIPQEFLTTYPNASIEVINKENYLDFVI